MSEKGISQADKNGIIFIRNTAGSFKNSLIMDKVLVMLRNSTKNEESNDEVIEVGLRIRIRAS